MLLILSFSLNAYILLFELFRDKSKWFDSLSIFTLFFCLSYSIPFFMWTAFPNNDLWYLTTNTKINESWEVFIVLAAVYLTISTSYVFFGLSKLGSKLRIVRVNRAKAALLISVFIVIYLVFFLLSILKYGSIFEYIKAGISSRAVMGGSTLGVVGYFRYILNGMILLLIIMLAYSWEYNKSLIYKFLIVLLFFMIVVFSMHTGGRGSFAQTFLILILFHLYVNKVSKRNVLVGGLFVLTGFVYIVLGKTLFFNIRTGRELLDGVSFKVSDLLENTVFIFSYFKYYLLSVLSSINEPSAYGTPRLGMDYILYMLSYIPGYNSYEYSERIDVINQTLFNHTTGYIPPGWIAYSLINGGVFWLLGKCFLMSFVFYVFDQGAKKHGNYSYLTQSFYFVLFWILLKFITSGDGVSNAQPFFGYYLLLIGLLLTMRVRRHS